MKSGAQYKQKCNCSERLQTLHLPREYTDMKKYEFTRDDTKLIKGIAILLMLAHHLWAFPDRLITALPLTSITPYGTAIAAMIGGFGKICVSLFMFWGGVGTYLSYEQNRLNWVKKIRGLYVSYWKVFFIFIPLGYLFFRGQADYCRDTSMCHIFDGFSRSAFLANLTGFSSSYNGEWWFFGCYLVTLAAFPLIVKIISGNTAGVNLWIVCIFEILITYVFPALRSETYFPALGSSWLYNTLICQSAPWAACFWCGCVFAREHLLERLQQDLDQAGLLNPAAALAALAGIFLLRTYVVGAELDIVYVPFFSIYGIYLVNQIEFLRKCLLKLGKQSTNMWLIHSFLIYYYYECARIILSIRNAVLVMIVFVIVTYLLACLVDKFYSALLRQGTKLLEKGRNCRKKDPVH